MPARIGSSKSPTPPPANPTLSVPVGGNHFFRPRPAKIHGSAAPPARDSSKMELSNRGGKQPLLGEEDRVSRPRGAFGAHLAPKDTESEEESGLREDAITALVRAGRAQCVWGDSAGLLGRPGWARACTGWWVVAWCGDVGTVCEREYVGAVLGWEPGSRW
jgi:hypothetical protein